MDIDGATQPTGFEDADPLFGARRIMGWLPDPETGEVPNIADLMEAHELAGIGGKVKREYEIDLASRTQWKEQIDKAMDVAMQVAEAKTYPWSGAANVKFPLMTSAAIQFAARAYPAIVPGRDVVKAKVIGKDPDGEKRRRASRVGRHMSWQLTEEMEEWEEDTDRLLHMLPIVGCLFRETWFDPMAGHNRSAMILPEDLVVHYDTRSLDACPRITKRFELYPAEITERMRTGIFRELELGRPSGAADDESAAHVFLEQHRTLDLDEDGYPEPYIVTVHEERAEVVRITLRCEAQDVELGDDGRIARITPTRYFTKYGFIPSPDGGFYDVGFGTLLNPLNAAINSTLNQLLDAGHLQNTGGGFIGSGLKLKGGTMRFKPGEYKVVQATGANIRDNVLPLPFPGPSLVLFQLLGLLIEAGKDITSVKDVMVGDQPTANQPAATTLALIEQGMKVFSAIYKRIRRALKAELKKLYRLNRIYLAEQTYFTVLDESHAAAKADYEDQSLDIVPVSVPSVVTDMQRLARAQFLMQFVDMPGIDSQAIIRHQFEAANIEDTEQLWSKEPPPPSPQEVMAKAQMQREAAELAIDRAEVIIKGAETEAKIAKIEAEIIKLLADAEAAEASPQLEVYKAQMKALVEGVKAAVKGAGDDRGRVSGLAGVSWLQNQVDTPNVVF